MPAESAAAYQKYMRSGVARAAEGNPLPRLVVACYEMRPRLAAAESVLSLDSGAGFVVGVLATQLEHVGLDRKFRWSPTALVGSSAGSAR